MSDTALSMDHPGKPWTFLPQLIINFMNIYCTSVMNFNTGYLLFLDLYTLTGE